MSGMGDRTVGLLYVDCNLLNFGLSLPPLAAEVHHEGLPRR
jgi:hypothetical protein